MFPYNNRISDYVAAFPGSVYTPKEVKNENPNGELLNESGTVPSAVDFEGRRRLNLDQVPQEQVGMTVTVEGSPRTLIPFGESPATGQVAVSMTTGVMEFHSSDAGLTVAVSYRGKGTPIMAFLFHQLGKELAAAQTLLLELDNDAVRRPDGGVTDGGVARWDGETGRLLSDGPVLGSMATQNANNVNISGGSVENISLGGEMNIQGVPQASSATHVLVQRSDESMGRIANVPIEKGGTSASTAAGARTNLGLGSVATRDGDSLTQRPLVITVSGSTTRNLLAAESGATVYIRAGNCIVNLPQSPPSGTYYWLRSTDSADEKLVSVTGEDTFFRANGPIDGMTSAGSTGASYATMLVSFDAPDNVWHVMYNNGWTNPV